MLKFKNNHYGKRHLAINSSQCPHPKTHTSYTVLASSLVLSVAALESAFLRVFTGVITNSGSAAAEYRPVEKQACGTLMLCPHPP